VSVSTDAIESKSTLLLTGVGIGILGLLVLVNKKLSAILQQAGELKLLNHPDFDHRTGEFDTEES